MKPLTTITLYSRDHMDPETLVKLAIVEVPSVGEVKVILTRDGMGQIFMEAAEVTPDKQWSDLTQEATTTLSELHAKMGELSIASQHALTDMFALHKWLTR